MAREILKLTREEDHKFGIYLDGGLWQKWSEEELHHPSVLWLRLWGAFAELIDRRLAPLNPGD